MTTASEVRFGTKEISEFVDLCYPGIYLPTTLNLLPMTGPALQAMFHTHRDNHKGFFAELIDRQLRPTRLRE